MRFRVVCGKHESYLTGLRESSVTTSGSQIANIFRIGFDGCESSTACTAQRFDSVVRCERRLKRRVFMRLNNLTPRGFGTECSVPKSTGHDCRLNSVEFAQLDRFQHPCFIGRNVRLNKFTLRASTTEPQFERQSRKIFPKSQRRVSFENDLFR